MSYLCDNQLIGIHDPSTAGIWRVVCRDYESCSTALARTPFPIDRTTPFDVASIPKLALKLHWLPDEELAALRHTQEVTEIDDFDLHSMITSLERLSSAAEKKARFRRQVMASFLSPDERARSLIKHGSFGGLVKNAYAAAKALEQPLTKVSIYKLIKYLIVFGFRAESLNPMFHRRGAPGTARPYGPDYGRKRPGRRSDVEKAGIATFETQCISLKMRAAIVAYAMRLDHAGRSEKSVYDAVLSRFFTRRLASDGDEIKPELPSAGEYPNFNQFRALYRKEVSHLDRLRSRTSTNFFRRNHRALTGTARDGVLGPGHLYAIDSTVANAYLRSGLDRSLYVGRPIVYWVIDVWSTAIVGFYVCLAAPSWRNAKAALFCVSAANLVSQLGLQYHVGLDPLPTLPARLLSDRGEYLSQGATETALAAGYTLSINTSYRPDLRGLGEQVHRITQDMQLGFVPGAFDVRRQELELNAARYEDSQLTVAEYVAYLSNIVEIYNRTSDRKKIAHVESTLDGADMTPGGLWAWGHAVGLGYRSRCAPDDACRHLLVPETFACRARGLFLRGARYQSEDLPPELALMARNKGRIELDGYMLPSAMGTAFVSVPDRTGGLLQVNMAAGQRVSEDVSLFDWADALAYQNCHATKTQRDRDQVRLDYLAQNEQIVRQATSATAEAGTKRPELSVLEARRLENEGGHFAQPSSTADRLPRTNDRLDDIVNRLLGGQHE